MTGLLTAVLSGFILALFAPWVHRLAPRRSGWILASLPFALTVYFVSYIGPLAHGDTFRTAFSWIPFLGIDLTFLLDGLSLLFCLLITGIGTLVVIYSGGYLAGHPQLGRFYAYILMFMASMLGVVLSDNAIALFVFWELTSLSSFFLIGFYHEKEASRVAALQALLVTGMGGLALMAGFLLMGQIYGTLELTQMMAQGGGPLQSSPLFLPVLFLVLAGAFTKSAQFPFHIWLPNAMEAPAPVSTYLHAATMVKAGIYLMARVNPLFLGSETWFWMLVGAGTVTMLLGAYLAMVQTDLKRILAYSTVSALGTLTLLLGLGTSRAAEAAMAYLLVHGLYKGTLFLTAGAVDHGTGTRDVNDLGGLRKAMPITALAAGLAALSMAGIPPFFGFIGKEAIYVAALGSPTAQGLVTAASLIANLLFVAIGLVVGIRPFVGASKETPHPPHEGSIELWIGPLILGALGLVAGLASGAVGHDFVLQAASAVLGRTVETHLSLWHGWNTAVALSMVTFAAGLTVFAIRKPLGSVMGAVARALGPVGPARGYFHVLEGTIGLARIVTRVFQSGYLNRYLLFVLFTTVGLAGYTLFFRAGFCLAGGGPECSILRGRARCGDAGGRRCSDPLQEPSGHGDRPGGRGLRSGAHLPVLRCAGPGHDADPGGNAHGDPLRARLLPVAEVHHLDPVCGHAPPRCRDRPCQRWPDDRPGPDGGQGPVEAEHCILLLREQPVSREGTQHRERHPRRFPRV